MFFNNTPLSVKKNYIRCDRSSIGKRKGCQILGKYDVNSVSHYPLNPLDDKSITVIKLKDEALRLCGEEGCNPGQRIGLSKQDVEDITNLYQCGKFLTSTYMNWSIYVHTFIARSKS